MKIKKSTAPVLLALAAGALILSSCSGKKERSNDEEQTTEVTAESSTAAQTGTTEVTPVAAHPSSVTEMIEDGLTLETTEYSYYFYYDDEWRLTSIGQDETHVASGEAKNERVLVSYPDDGIRLALEGTDTAQLLRTDDAGRVAEIVDDSAGAAPRTLMTMSYDAEGQLTMIYDGEKHPRAAYVWGDGLIKQISSTKGSSSTVYSFSYGDEPNNVGLTLFFIEGLGPLPEEWFGRKVTYLPEKRVYQDTYPGTDIPVTVTSEYEYMHDSEGRLYQIYIREYLHAEEDEQLGDLSRPWHDITYVFHYDD